MAYDAVLGDPTPDSANEGRGKWNAMAAELDSRLAVIEAGTPAHQIYESPADVLNKTTTLADTGLEFPVAANVPHNFFAMILWSPELFDPLWSNSSTQPADANQGMVPAVSGPGSATTDVDWLAYWWTMWFTDNDSFQWIGYSRYNYAPTGSNPVRYGDIGSVGDRVYLMHGYVKPPSSGTFKIRFRAFDATAAANNGVIVRAGSTVEVW